MRAVGSMSRRSEGSMRQSVGRCSSIQVARVIRCYVVVAVAFVTSCSDSTGDTEFGTRAAVCIELNDLAMDAMTTSGRLPHLEERLHALLDSPALIGAQRGGVEKLLRAAEHPETMDSEELTDASFGFIDLVARTCP